MRLIDADRLIRFIDIGHLRSPNEQCFSENDVVEMINAQPTAYDVDKVTNQLQEASTRNAAECKKLQGEASGLDAMIHRSDLHSFATSCYDHAANIVRRGGAE